MKVNMSSCALALLAVSAAYPKDPLQEVLARMDEAAAQFQGMTAKVHYTTHIKVIDDTAEESGSVIMKKVHPDEVAGRIDFLQPNPRTVIFEKRKAEIYYPKIKTVQVYDLGSKGEQLDRFLLIGFGTSGTELARDYEVKVLGTETTAGKSAIKLELTPKSEDIKKVVAKLELWIPESPGQPYPAQEKIYEKTPGDFRIINYTDLKINPAISDKVIKLKLPAGVKTEYPQK